jgi:succinyl-CoA synthetase beta subunit
MRCDIIARGIIEATESLELKVPLVVRLSGTNFEQGRKILKASTLNIHSVDNLAQGAQKIVALIGGEQ